TLGNTTHLIDTHPSLLDLITILQIPQLVSPDKQLPNSDHRIRSIKIRPDCFPQHASSFLWHYAQRLRPIDN
ncbi:hypothetical protein SERLADRAFT_459467, partial [Serpula lacrymans var. lacrymans S7.9]